MTSREEQARHLECLDAEIAETCARLREGDYALLDYSLEGITSPDILSLSATVVVASSGEKYGENATRRTLGISLVRNPWSVLRYLYGAVFSRRDIGSHNIRRIHRSRSLSVLSICSGNASVGHQKACSHLESTNPGSRATRRRGRRDSRTASPRVARVTIKCGGAKINSRAALAKRWEKRASLLPKPLPIGLSAHSPFEKAVAEGARQ